MRKLAAVVLAAGKSTRMKSELTKLLHPLGEKPLIQWVVDACRNSGISRIIVVVGHQAEKIEQTLGEACEYVHQREPLGTGHALMQVEHLLSEYDGDLLVLVGDAPFVTSRILREFVGYHRQTGSHATILTGRLEHPGSYGRIVRGEGGMVDRIVEAKDAGPEELRINEVNSAIYCFDAPTILPLLHLIGNENVKHEYLLTDVIKIAREQNLRVESFVSSDPNVVRGLNSDEDFELARRLLAKRPGTGCS